jgi:hypothetical protein
MRDLLVGAQRGLEGFVLHLPLGLLFNLGALVTAAAAAAARAARAADRGARAARRRGAAAVALLRALDLLERL